MYEAFYHLNKRPFALTPDSAFLFPSATHRRALSYLIYGLGQREGFIVITGDVGTGKTLTIQAMLSYLEHNRIHGVRLAAANVEAGDVLPLVAGAFGIQPDASKAVLQSTLERKLAEQYRDGVLLIVDEGQTFSMDALEELRILSNMSVDGRALMQISLVGQSELRTTLEMPGMDQLWQRIIAWHHLQALDVAEVQEYVEYRLHIAGAKDVPRLDEDIFPLLHEWSEGIPRRINILMDRFLLFGYLEERERLDLDALHSVIGDLEQEFKRPTRHAETSATRNDSTKGIQVVPGLDLNVLQKRFETMERGLAGLLGPSEVQRILVDQEEAAPVDTEKGSGAALLARLDRLETMLASLKRNSHKSRK